MRATLYAKPRLELAVAWDLFELFWVDNGQVAGEMLHRCQVLKIFEHVQSDIADSNILYLRRQTEPAIKVDEHNLFGR